MSESTQSHGLVAEDPSLDLAFLRAIAVHRPLGHHKHFNFIPILNAVYTSLLQGKDRESHADDEGDEEAQLTDREAISAALQSVPPLTRARWLEAEKVAAPQVVWDRCSELYNMSGLDELEETASQMEAEASAVSNLEASTSLSSSGIPLDVPSPLILERRDFGLHPWADFEDLIAPRRIADEDEELDTEHDAPRGRAEVEDDSDDELSDEDEEDEAGDGEEEDEEEEEDNQPERASTSRGRRGSKATTALKSTKPTQRKAAATRNAPRMTRSSRR